MYKDGYMYLFSSQHTFTDSKSECDRWGPKKGISLPWLVTIWGPMFVFILTLTDNCFSFTSAQAGSLVPAPPTMSNICDSSSGLCSVDTFPRTENIETSSRRLSVPEILLCPVLSWTRTDGRTHSYINGKTPRLTRDKIAASPLWTFLITIFFQKSQTFTS